MAGALRVNGKMLCPRCKIPMYYTSETVRDSRGVYITRYYLCPACRAKLVDERITITKSGDSVKAVFSVDGRTVIAFRVERPKKRR